MGYDLERFVCYVNDGLLCSVCRGVLERPLQAPCEHAYCSICISSWVIQHHYCPEDRQPLEVSSLKPLCRYMRNDLNRLQIRCVNAAQGCKVICSLEILEKHEDECEFGIISCSNPGCSVQVEKWRLKAHLSKCNLRCGDCRSACGLLSIDRSQYDSVVKMDTIRAEMLCVVEEMSRALESQLDSNRRHMMQQLLQLKNELDKIKDQIAQMKSDIRLMLAVGCFKKQECPVAELQITRNQNSAEQAPRE
ncbi:E3 ubiquitin-protein ligase NRDP1 [Thalassophryne amazonica]|uniref:E3 ubiquitin-protein ligase NRDP1 n=1 Tax=Thalassophryne amazonica TaxID=390379 RepID=UPI0014723CD1|nr:E3 ubiquitin-protein ligase NRDP1 [Thalassophryne amazonica]